MEARRKGRHVRALVPSAVGYNNAAINDTTMIPLQDHTSIGEKGEGFSIGSASTISVFTNFLTAIAVYPATESDASQPPTAAKQKVLTGNLTRKQ